MSAFHPLPFKYVFFGFTDDFEAVKNMTEEGGISKKLLQKGLKETTWSSKNKI